VRTLNFVLLFSNFIPISLIVSISVVKVIQMFFFLGDDDMVYNGIRCMPRTSDLNEEMGQIEYVFSDKTGTLTQNIMDFRKFCVQGVTYGEGMTEIKRNVLQKMGKHVEDDPLPPPGARKTRHVDLIDNSLDDLLQSKKGAQYTAVRAFLLHLAINHEVVTDTAADGDLLYCASSPDEEALCYGARHFGYTFKARDSQGVTIQLDDGTTLKARIFCVLKFNSTRKRSSVICQFEDTEPSGETKSKLMLFTKGADSVILARLAPRLQNAPETKQTMDVLKEMAEDGLRTLCLAGRELTQQEYATWMIKYEDASCATEQRTEKLDAVAELIENNLEVHGITGVEDRLQEGVAHTIVKMAEADIKVWMLTGDKGETA